MRNRNFHFKPLHGITAAAATESSVTMSETESVILCYYFSTWNLGNQLFGLIVSQNSRIGHFFDRQHFC
jgi:hypothetical protein